jgi:hypothetical protein
MKKYLCKEHGELFTIQAESLEEAQEKVIFWNGEVICELDEPE